VAADAALEPQVKHIAAAVGSTAGYVPADLDGTR
jgi:hypothetical protein